MRLKAIDTLKIASVFLVIMSHVTLYFLLIKSNDFFYIYSDSQGNLVPLFFMCSGFFNEQQKR